MIIVTLFVIFSIILKSIKNTTTSNSITKFPLMQGVEVAQKIEFDYIVFVA